MIPEIKVDGLNDAIKALEKLGPETAIREARGLARFGGNIIRKRARQNLEPHTKTGRLSRGLQVAVRFVRFKGVVKGTIRTTRDSFYGMFLELGTERIAGVRWLTRAANASTATMASRLARQLEKRLNTIVRRLR